jgi:DNA primase
MAAMDDVARVREKIDIVSLISEYIPLKKMGRNFKSLCPFHTEKTPSFVVSPERQIWHCFGGCAKGGDCFTFLMEYENLEFVEALRILAKKAGVELRTSSFQTGLSSKKEKIYILNRLANEFYHYVLIKHSAGEKALSYLFENRKLNTELINTFMLGFSPKSGNALVNYLVNKKGYKKQELIEAGLAFQKGEDTVDFFRGRIMFSLSDHRNNIVGFSGRAIDSEFVGGKYINTRDTIVYHKGGMFFGLNIAKDEIKKKDCAIVVEGEFDVISMFKEGIKNVVAIKGTALTDNQASLLSRFTQNASLCFDQDAAGWQATNRSLAVLEKKGFNITVVVTTNGKDADESIKNDPFVFKKAIKDRVGVYDYIFSRVFALHNKNTIDGKKKIADELLPTLSRIENEIVKEHYLKKLSTELDTSYESLIKQVERIEKKEIIGQKRAFVKVDKTSRKEVLEEYLLALIIQYENPNLILDKVIKILKDYAFEAPSYKKILDFLAFYFKKYNVFDSKKFLSSLPSELVKTFDTCFLFPMPRFLNNKKNEEEVEKVARELRMIFLKDKIKLITQNLKNEEKERNSKEIEALGKEVSILIHLLSRL